MAESHALLMRRLGRRAAIQFLDEIESAAMTVIRLSTLDEQKARQILRSYEDKDFSYTDATSFVLMNRLGITTALTLDRHFAQFGFAVAPDLG